MRIKGLLDSLLPRGFQEVSSATKQSELKLRLPISLLSSFFDSLSPPIMSDIDLAFYDSETLARSLISHIHQQRSEHGVYASTSQDTLETLAWADMTSLINLILDLQRRTLHLLASECRSSDEIVELQETNLEALYESKDRDDDKDEVKIREEIPSLPSSIVDLCHPFESEEFASKHCLCPPGKVFQIVGNETDTAVLALHSLLRTLSFSPHLEALWISHEPETLDPDNGNRTNPNSNIAKKASRIWETLSSKSLVVGDQNRTRNQSPSRIQDLRQNSFTKLRPLERLSLSSIPSGSLPEEALNLVDTMIESKYRDDDGNEAEEMDHDEKSKKKSSLALVVIDSIDGILGKRMQGNESSASIVELGVGLVERARRNGMRIYVLNSTSSTNRKNSASTFSSNYSIPSLGNLLSHTIDGTLQITPASTLINSLGNEGKEDETELRQLISEKSWIRKLDSRLRDKDESLDQTQFQTQTQTQTQRKLKAMRTLVIEKLEDGNDFRGLWSSYRTDGVDLFETREIE